MSAFGSDIGVTASLLLARDQWRQDLMSAKTDLEQFARDVQSIRIRIPVDVDLTRAIDEISQFRLRQNATPITIPIQLDPSGMGAPGGVPGASAMVPGAMAAASTASVAQFMRLQPYLGGAMSSMATGAAALTASDLAELTSGASARDLAMLGLSGSGAPAGEAGAMAAASGGGSRGGMRGLRLFMAAHIAAHGLEAVHSSYELNRTMSEMATSGLDIDEQGKSAIDAIKKMRGGMMGLTGAARDVLSSVLPGSSFMNFVSAHPAISSALSMTPMYGMMTGALTSGDFDDAARIKDIQQSITSDKAIAQGGQILQSGFGRIDAMRESVRLEGMPSGLNKQMEEIHKQTQSWVEGIDKEARELDKAASKIKDVVAKQHLINEAQLMRSQARTLGGEMEGAEWTRATGELIEHNDKVSAENVLTIQQLRSQLTGDTLGAQMATIQKGRTDALTDWQKYADANRISQAYRDQRETQINQIYDTKEAIATKAERLRTGRIEGQISAAGIDSPFARQLNQIATTTAEMMGADKAHAGLHERLGIAEAAKLIRSHDAHVNQLNQTAYIDELQLAHQDRTAEVMRIRVETEAALAANQGDPGAQQAIRRAAEAKLEGVLKGSQRASTSDLRGFQLELLASNFANAGPDARRARSAAQGLLDRYHAQDHGGGGVGGDGGISEAAKALLEAAEIIKGAQSLYVVH